ncbi:7-cyano-7-deazaguanine synthase [Mesorhizobium sp. M0179]|uniref:Qat anti-phage system QueC-like protein QatC n=1 Tax=Mesorhizobium sp. M0179 TaxID=2956905 RepID=UPI003335351B
MTLCRFFLDKKTFPADCPPNELHVLLYGGSAPIAGAVAIGNQVKDLFLRFGVQPSATAVDFVSIALAVTAADTFVLREDAADSWSRDIEICLPLRTPGPWNAVKTRLQRLLSFLSGDQWRFHFEGGGEAPPVPSVIRQHQSRINLVAGDLVSLFSGGLDSTIATFRLVEDSARPILVSHAYTGDKSVQNGIVGRLPQTLQHVSVNAWPNSERTSEISMRSRSFLFIAIAALVCDVKSRLVGGRPIPLQVPENGLIALNAPLTPRRIGSHSTRTTHPFFLDGVQAIFGVVGIPATIDNPYATWTKGQMVRSVNGVQLFQAIASETVSCGKWKREGQQCGRCVPCLIRRASLYEGDVDDRTLYQSASLLDVMTVEDTRDDLVAMLTAVKRLDGANLDAWVAQSGPLPADIDRRSALVDVHRRGLMEVGRYLADSGFKM